MKGPANQEGNKSEESKYTWIPFYKELAQIIAKYGYEIKNELLNFVHSLSAYNLPIPELNDVDHNNNLFQLSEIDPFTFYSFFNRQITDENRIKICEIIKKNFKISAMVPSDFTGIPVMDNRNTWFFAYEAKRNPDDIQLLWNFFINIVDGLPLEKTDFASVINIRNVKTKITTGLFWIAPERFISLDSRMLNYLGEKMPTRFTPEFYTHCLKKAKNYEMPFYELSYEAWKKSQSSNLTSKDLLNMNDEEVTKLKEAASSKEAINRIKEAKASKSAELSLSGLDLKAVPKEIGDLVNLKALSLDNNQLEKLPQDFKKLKNLVSLGLKNNGFANIPESILSLNQLVSLDLRDNKINNLPRLLPKLKTLKTILLSGNELSYIPGNVTKWLGSLESHDLNLQKYMQQSVNPVSDNPTNVDQLGRESFAGSIANKLNIIWEDNQNSEVDAPIMIHLYGPWGSGKSSLIHFIEKRLKDINPVKSKWRVIKFNAWQNQHIDPPWWSLYSEIRKQGLGWFQRILLHIGSYFNQVFKNKAPYIFALTIASLILFVKKEYISGVTFFCTDISGYIKTINGGVTLLGSIFSLFIAFGRVIFLTSAENATLFMTEKNNPMIVIRKKFREAMNKIKYPILVVIDDMDRCHTGYTVKLLEGIQTLFASKNVAYLVAGDRRWLYSCYEKVYCDFKDDIKEPGKRLGAHFLEKAFEFSFPVPGISEEIKEQFWKDLLGKNRGGSSFESDRQNTSDSESSGDVRNTIKEDLKRVDNESDIFSIGEKYKGNFQAEQAYREAVIEKLSQRHMMETTEHFLLQFWELVEPNPRSMKRLLNAYSIQRELAVLSGFDLKDENFRNQLVLFAIVSLRWPDLERALNKKPEIADIIKSKQNVDSIDDKGIKKLIFNPDVEDVFYNNKIGVTLDSKAVEVFVSLQSEGDADSSVT